MTSPEHGIYYIEVVAEDAEAARDFYSAAYGWHFQDATPELGGAFVAVLPGGAVCGIRAPMSEQEQPIVRTYLRVADIDASIKRAAELGALVALEPTELGGWGRVAIYFLGGIQQGIWQVA